MEGRSRVRQVRARALLCLAVLNIFVLVAGFVALDVVRSRPPATMPYPVAFAEDAPDAAPQDAPRVDPERLADKLDDPMSDSGFADGLTAFVADAQTGDRLFARDGDETAVPASTTKIVTAVAALHAMGPSARLSTDVVRDDNGGIVLVGGGDPTISTDGTFEHYPRPATMENLAIETAAALRESGTDSVSLAYDESLYSGSDMPPGWKPTYVTEGSAATVHALMLDGGRVHPEQHYSERVEDPPSVAADAFAEQLEEAGIEVTGDPAPGEAPDNADPIASVQSPPLSELVEWMLLESDNNIAEALFRQVALAQGHDASSAGGTEAVDEIMTELKVDDVHIEDGSGLSVNNRITPKALVDLVLLAADPEHPGLHATLSGLPTAHFTGTLDSRYSPESGSYAGAGVVHAKTGTLNGVSTLAGTAQTADGRLLAFAFMANDPAAMASTLDTFTSVLAECGCS
ncbi:D-alanyl-D-alanine carboxypeptidase/D-alanyl-D-alanine-endopeptidase [Streptomonospora sp. S1-112]|uniref:D-alanyl-D-alanine carboxypeptidase/D-alanyl-D-alanine-endopeptidase n=2 Tax=Streptomonospora mangrovi TaxID=2883123 RepID=A0A9X3NN39_9ACTN|nr:D-alanyl-D-alanine carboxypeptidase/D-alanyl-D-alanine-endopeptidase [Streptomonospora mangrovi]MDA0563570.1 D-alanyl-D-alanine carboxypeptidase/D-alanyl-D-alanine-endopeptidase [Streptomonospora mangrovi]